MIQQHQQGKNDDAKKEEDSIDCSISGKQIFLDPFEAIRSWSVYLPIINDKHKHLLIPFGIVIVFNHIVFVFLIFYVGKK